MRLLTGCLAGCLLLLFGCEDITIANGDQAQFVLNSAFTDRAYEMTVLLPPDYDPQQTYPSVYLVDGHWHYKGAAQAAQQLMEDGKIRDIILIGIAYNGIIPNSLGGFGEISSLRIDDLTATKNDEADSLGGKAHLFRQFFQEELIPEIESRYSTSKSERTLMGHSLGGYLGIWEMLTFRDSSLFEYVEAGSPALWWGDGDLLSREASLDAQASLPFKFHTTMGTLESVVWNTFYDEFEARLNDKQYTGLTYVFERYPVGHASTAEIGFEDGLLYFFGN